MTMENHPKPQNGREALSSGGNGAAPARTRREITSTELLAGGREVNIRHADEIYTLRQTNKGKLILTK
jgi:hemin uptake protein HemP